MKACLKACLAALVFMAAFVSATRLDAASLVENLNRGVVAVRTSNTDVFVGWRLLGTDPAEVSFNLYRSANGGVPVKLNAQPLTGATSLTDSTADLTVDNVYSVRAISGGIESPAGAPFTLPANTSIQQYLRILLQRPAGGVTPVGAAYSYSPNDMSVGDVDGDGEYELFVKWEPSNQLDAASDGYTGNTYLDAYRMNGARLWRVDLGVNVRAGPHDVPFIVFDLDGDGRAELAVRTAAGTRDGLGNFVADPAKYHGPYPSEPFSHTADYRGTNGRALVGPEFLTIFDGLTGAERASSKMLPARHPDTDFPTSAQLFDVWGDTSGNRQGRFYFPGIAYLDGERPSLVFGRGYAGGQQNHPGRVAVAAWNYRDGQITPLWQLDSRGHPLERSIAGQGAHSASVGDLDGDGRDDIIYGQVWIRHDGSLIRTGFGHGDALHVSRMDPDRTGQQVFMPHESPAAYGPNALTYEDGATGGSLIFGVTATGDIGRGVAADIDPRFRGFEMWASGATGGLYNVQSSTPNATVGPRGLAVSASKPSQINFAVFWDGDLLREILDNVTISKWNWTTESVNTLFTPSGVSANNGSKNTPNLQADLLGDWREEVIWRETANDAIRIYTTTIPTTYRITTLMHDRQYRSAIAFQNVGYNQPPHVSFYLGHDMPTPPRPDIVTSLGPPKPVFTSITTDTGSSASDNITSDTTLVLSGTAKIGSTVAITRVGTGLIGSVVADGSGNWTLDYTANALTDGLVSFTAIATDATGTSSVTSPFVVTVDTTAPAAPSIGAISGGATWTFTGQAEANAAITVSQGGNIVATGSSDGSGFFTATGAALPPSTYVFTANAADLAGNVSLTSGSYALNTTATAPALTGLVNDNGSSNDDEITNDSTLILKGTGQPGQTITITRVGLGVIGTAVVAQDGTWSFDYSSVELPSGSYAFIVVATDGGASSFTSAALDVVVNTQAPTVVSSDRSAPTAATVGSVAGFNLVYRVTFNDTVSGVDLGDFTIATTGTATATLASVTPVSGSVYDVSIGNLSGEGTLRLDLNATGTGISDTAGNAFGDGFATGQTYTLAVNAGGVWTRLPTGGLWSDPQNWENYLVANGTGSVANFNTLNITENNTVQLDSARTIGGAIFGDTTASSAASWTLSDNGSAANALTLAVPSGSPTVTVNALGTAATATVSTVLAGNQGLTKNGAGTLVITTPSTLTGEVNVTNGTLRYDAGGSMSVGNSATNVNTTANATLLVNGGSYAGDGLVTLGGPNTIAGILRVESGTLNLGGTVRTNNDGGSTVRINGGTATIADVNIRRNSAGTVDFNSGFIVNGGVANVGTIGLGTGNSNGALSVQGEGVLNVSGPVTVANQQTAGRGGALRVINNGIFTSTDTVSGVVLAKAFALVNADNTIASNLNNVASATFTGGVSTIEKFTLGAPTSVTVNGVTSTFESSLGSATITINGGTVYLGSGGIAKVGTLATTLSLSSGTLGAKAPWSIAHPVTLPAAGNVNLKAADAADAPVDIALTGVLSGAGGFTKTGAGTLTLSAANTFTGAVNVNAGTLRVLNSLGGTSALNVNTGGTLAGDGILARTVTLNTGGTVSPDGASAVATLTTAGLTWNGDGVIAFDLGAGTDQLTITGALTKSGTGAYRFQFAPDATVAPGSYLLATFGSTDFAAADLTATGLPAGLAGRFVIGANDLQLVVYPAPAITSVATASGMFGSAFSYTITATENPTSFGALNLPPGLTVDEATGVISGIPTAAGSYATTVTATNAAGTGSAPLAITIAKAPTTLFIGSSAGTPVRRAYTGMPISAIATTTPAGLDVQFTYNGSSTTPTLPGTYAVHGTIDDANYEGSAEGTLTILTTATVRHLPSLNGDIDGSAQVLTPESITLNGGALIANDLLVPGTPGVVVNGTSVLAGILDATGAATPANHTITLNDSLIRYVVRRVDPVTMPAAQAAITPTGTRSVTLNGSKDSVGSFATLRNLTVNGGAGTIDLPAGAYGNIAANGNANIVLGKAGSTEPTVYSFQSLTLNGSSKILVVGPVQLRIAQNIAISGSIGNSARSNWLTLELATANLTLNGSAAVYGEVIAPAGTITLNDSSVLRGRLAADRLIVNTNAVVQEVAP